MAQPKLNALLPRFADIQTLRDARNNKSQLKVLHYWGDADPLGDSEAVAVDDACIAAMETLHASGNRHAVTGQFGGNPLACNPDKHPDAKVISGWIASVGHPPSDLQVIFWLAYIVRNEWAHFPKRTRTGHREIYLRIARLCRELRAAMDETDMPFMQGDGHGVQTLSMLELLTNRELDNVAKACDTARGTHEKSRVFSKRERRLFALLLTFDDAVMPTMQTLLERLEREARRLEREGPIHSQPTKRGAERGYFVRRMGELFQRRYGEQPHEVIAALTTIALGETTDRELVAKLLA